ncbi:hypothetical protein HPC49_03860 [Pyxidicoccus fallax]|uniref:Uncharacterized protein n=1 Tax=Pyxidicoccus fallax TaxID=394095 RepID=A0A848L8P5_9BACT|nr:hypothetical protein [Pyxidicoccus fallax]NMO14622.1 hypothetical protein [Pyxidicoccus fallax]NPC77386.1 hypothetical protein [Pyxidicoccus fallax]
MTPTTVGLLLLLGMAPTENASAAERDTVAEAPACHDDDSRRLGGHTFLFPMLQQSAFVTTHVGLREGIARYDVPDLPVGRLGRTDVLLTGVQQTLDLELAVTDWLGLAGFARGTVITGANTRSLLVDGASVNLVGQAGAIVRVWRNANSGTQLSLRGNFGYEDGSEVTVLPLVSGILNNPLLTLEDVVQGSLGEFILVPRTETSVNGGAFLAQALGRTFSLQAAANAEYGWREREPFDAEAGGRVTQKTHAARVNLTAALTADFSPHGVPVALMGEYLFSFGEETEVGLPDRTLKSSTVALGVYYSGRPNLQVGLGAVTTLNAAPRFGLGEADQRLESDDPTLSYGQLILRYIW